MALQNASDGLIPSNVVVRALQSHINYDTLPVICDVREGGASSRNKLYNMWF